MTAETDGKIDPLLHLAGYFKWESDENAVLRARILELEAELATLRTSLSRATDENARLRDAVEKAHDMFVHYGDLHAAKPDTVKAGRNYDLAREMRRALKTGGEK